MRHLFILLLFLPAVMQAQHKYIEYDKAEQLTAHSGSKLVVAISIPYGLAIPYRNSGNPNAKVSNATIGFVNADLVFKAQYSNFDGFVGLRAGGFGFDVSPVARLAPGDDTTHGRVGCGMLRVAGGGILRWPAGSATELNLSFAGGAGVGMGGFLVGMKAFVAAEVYAGVCMGDFINAGIRYIIIPGNFAGYKYLDSYSHKRGNYAVTPEYGVQGIMAEIGIKLHRPRF